LIATTSDTEVIVGTKNLADISTDQSNSMLTRTTATSTASETTLRLLLLPLTIITNRRSAPMADMIQHCPSSHQTSQVLTIYGITTQGLA